MSAGILGELVGDHLGWRGLLGAVLILAAVVIAEFGGRTHQPEAIGAELVILPEAPAGGG